MTLEALEKALDRQLSWRKKELLTLRSDAAIANGPAQVTLVRCLIALSYSHLEGFTKKAARLYFEFILGRDRQYRELSDNIVAAAISRRAFEPTTKVSYYEETAVFLRYLQSDTASFHVPDDIHAMGMLDSSRLKNILYCLTIDAGEFELRYKWLDNDLIPDRNRVAHGEFLEIDLSKIDAYLALCDDSLQLIDLLRSKIVLGASERHYLRTPLPVLEGERI